VVKIRMPYHHQRHEKSTDSYTVPAFLGLLATAFAGVGADGVLRGTVSGMIIAFLMALFFFCMSFMWNSLAPDLSKRLTESATVVATDFRAWLAVAFLVFAYIAITPYALQPRALVRSDSSMAPPGNSSEPIQRAFVDVDPNFLIDIVSTRPSAEAAQLISEYEGRWMKVAGPLRGPASRTGRGVLIDIGLPTRHSVNCTLDGQQADLAISLKPDSDVSVIGQIKKQGVTILWVSLDHCEIISSK
jgi:hypothetical protein